MDLFRGMLVASSNAGKLKEIREILKDYIHVNIFSLTDLGAEPVEVEETGNTFEENALIKAKFYAEKLGYVTLADDSGLEVDYLKGEPGVKSARYAGVGAKDSDLCNKILKKLEGVPLDKRTARFKCVICLYDPVDMSYLFYEGTCEGTIAIKASGKNGFGYDPVFIPNDFAPKTIAELSSSIKNSISHRGRALSLLKEKLLYC
ncbi:MAG: RdgB/HAM1 family non-canonical purine NTP pyrophosphatase [bacterium]